MAHVAEYKKEIVNELVQMIKGSRIIGSVNMENLPAQQLQKMREQLRDTVKIKMAKRRLIAIALEQCEDTHPGISKLKDKLKGMPALLFTDDNPFKLYKTLQKNKSPAPAKAGQVAPKDIVVNAGPTGFAPGPIIGELGAMGIKAGIEGGKVAIKEDKIVAKEGDVISPKLAEILTRLGVHPMEVGLDLIAVYEDGNIYGKDILSVDESAYIEQIMVAHRGSFNLAMNIAYVSKDTVGLLIQKSYNDAKALGLECNVLSPELIEQLLARLYMTASNLKTELKI